MKNNRAAISNRHLEILNLVRKKGEVKVEEISSTFHVSPMTVRRDLQMLEKEGLLYRTHGYAISMDRAHQMLSEDEKIALCRNRISEYATRFIDNGDKIFINGSRTALNMLNFIKDKKVNIVTNNCWGINHTFPDNISICYTGGELRNNIMVGAYVMRNLLTMSADKTFLGCAAVYEDGEFRYDIPTEIGINEAMISRTSRQLYILADHSKIQRTENRESIYGSCTYDCPCTLITDDNAKPSSVESLRKHGINVILVPTK